MFLPQEMEESRTWNFEHWMKGKRGHIGCWFGGTWREWIGRSIGRLPSIQRGK